MTHDPIDPPISALMRRDVVRIDLDATVPELRAMFTTTGLSWAPVADGEGAVVGVISATDLSGPRVEGHEGDDLRAWQFCTYRPLTVRVDDSARSVARAMVDRGVHHVVVVDDRGMCGVASSLDLLRAYAGAADTADQSRSSPASPAS